MPCLHFVVPSRKVEYRPWFDPEQTTLLSARVILSLQSSQAVFRNVTFTSSISADFPTLNSFWVTMAGDVFAYGVVLLERFIWQMGIDSNRPDEYNLIQWVRYLETLNTAYCDLPSYRSKAPDFLMSSDWSVVLNSFYPAFHHLSHWQVRKRFKTASFFEYRPRFLSRITTHQSWYRGDRASPQLRPFSEVPKTINEGIAAQTWRVVSFLYSVHATYLFPSDICLGPVYQ